MKIFKINRWREIKEKDMSRWLNNKIMEIYLEKDSPFYRGNRDEQIRFNGKNYIYKANFLYAGHGNWDIKVYSKRRNNK